MVMLMTLLIMAETTHIVIVVDLGLCNLRSLEAMHALFMDCSSVLLLIFFVLFNLSAALAIGGASAAAASSSTTTATTAS